MNLARSGYCMAWWWYIMSGSDASALQAMTCSVAQSSQRNSISMHSSSATMMLSATSVTIALMSL